MKTIPEHATISLLKSELGKIGYTSRTIVLGENNYTQFTSPAGCIWITSNTHINYPFVTSSARTISDQKYLAYELAETLGVRIPKLQLVSGGIYDKKLLKKLLAWAPLVVKPNNASLSHGLTLNVTDLDQLKAAITAAMEYSPDVLVQEQVSGQEIRFVVLDGVVTAALLRETPRIVGDGAHTARQLLETENEARAALQMPYLTYPQLQEPLVSFVGIDMDRVPQQGEIIELGKSTMIGGGASVYNILDEIHQSYLQTVTRLANALGKGFLVVDVFIEDHAAPQTETNYAFIEFNMSPVLKLCYSCRDGNNYDVFSHLIPLIDTSLHKGELRG